MACNLQAAVSFVTANLNNFPATQPVLNMTEAGNERIVIIKALSSPTATAVLGLSSVNNIAILSSFQTYYLSSLYSVTLQVFESNWVALDNYPALLNNYSTTAISNSVVVEPSPKASVVFLDLTTVSKTVLLPQIASFSPSLSLCYKYSIKDIAGNASFSTLFLSTSGGDSIDSFPKPFLAIDDDYACVDLVADPSKNTWFITNYYYGTMS